MILHIFVAFNAFLGCSGQPKFDDHSPDVFAASFKRHLMTGDEAQVFQFENVSWYHIGTYDDETMKITTLPEKVKLVDCSEILSVRKIKSKLLAEAEKAEQKEFKKNE